MNIHNLTCASCKWWRMLADENLGECRALPPIPLPMADAKGETEVQTHWPSTLATDGCGQHRPRKGGRKA